MKLSWLRLGIYALVALGGVAFLTTAYFSWRDAQRKVGWDNALAEVASQNAEAKKAAEDVRDKVDACFNGGGSWNVSTGACDR